MYKLLKKTRLHVLITLISHAAGNKGLCGKPLQSCETPIPPPDTEPSLTPPGEGIPSTNAINIGNKSSPSPARIAVIVISALLGLFLLVLLFLLYWRSRGSQTPRLGRELSPAPSDGKSASPPVAAAPAASTQMGTGSGRKGGEQQQQQQQAGKLTFVRDDRQKFDLQDLMRASAEVLGSGNFGASYKAVLVDGEALVVKRFKQMNNVAKEDFHEHMRRLGRLKHPNLLPLVAYLYRKEEKLLVFDYVHNGSLHSELPALTIPHGHLKSSNVLIDNNFNPLLMDYTLAPVVNPSQVHEILVAYKSPEYAKNGRACKKTDVWCLGILILETLTGKLIAKYLSQGCGQYSAELAGWINAIVGGSSAHVFDREMEISDESCRLQMEKLLQIGIACCQEDLKKPSQAAKISITEVTKQEMNESQIILRIRLSFLVVVLAFNSVPSLFFLCVEPSSYWVRERGKSDNFQNLADKNKTQSIR